MQKFDHRQGVKNVVIALHFNKCSGGYNVLKNMPKFEQG